MKKRLSITLIGLLSLFIYSFSIAEDADKATASVEDVAPTASEAKKKAEAEGSETNDTAMADVKAEDTNTEASTKKEPEKAAVPAILGDSILLYSLRGTNDVDELSEEFPNRRIMAVDGGIDVAFEEQPPMIPHNTDKDRISLQENSCLKCHSRVDAKLEDAPRPPKSHFMARDGSYSKKVSAGRYFCTQCHVPQANKKPVVKNTYKN